MASTTTTYSSLSERDSAHIWHPFTQMQTAKAPIPIVKGEGIYLYDENETSYLDAISSWWVNLHGHSHPYIAKEIALQAKELEHVIFAGFTHTPAVDLACKLASLLPGSISKIFYSDNGSTAVEVAIKMAIQYWFNQGVNKTEIICFKNGYHGDTFGAMSAAGKNAFNKPFWDYLFDVHAIDPPLPGYENQSLSQIKDILKKGNVACFIFEPLVLGASGMITYPAKGLDLLIQCCQEFDVLTVADEVMTGFGRTGALFACDLLENQPDFICLSKGLTGGFLPLGVTATTERVFQRFLSDKLMEAFLHGHSYSANPLACRSALASLDLLLNDHCFNQRKMIEKKHQLFCKKWKSHHKLKRCDVLGTLLILEYQTDFSSYDHKIRDQLYNFFLSKGILLRPLGNTLYVSPPYCITSAELDFIYHSIVSTLEGEI